MLPIQPESLNLCLNYGNSGFIELTFEAYPVLDGFKMTVFSRTVSAIRMKCVLKTILILLLLDACLFDSSKDGSGNLSDARLQSLVDSLIPIIAANRGSQFMRPVHAKGISIEEALLIQEAVNNEDENEELFFQREFYQIGFTPDSSYNISDKYEEILSTAIAGFYIPGTDTLYVIQNQPISGEDEWLQFKFTVYHELVHAIQDQSFNAFQEIKSLVHNAEQQVDFDLARRMMIEGDAEYNLYLFMNDTSDLNLYKILALDLQWLQGQEEFKTDFYLNYLFMTPYTIGPAFIAEKYKAADGWTLVNELFYDNELTAAEVITGIKTAYRQFPAEYINSLLNAPSYAYFDDVNLGVINIFGLLGGKISRANAQAAIGWNGDHLIYVSNDYTGDGKFIWCFSFVSFDWAETVYPLLEEKILERASGPAQWTYTGDGAYPDSIILYKQYSNAASKSALVKNKNEIYWIENLAEYETALLDILVKGQIPVTAKKGLSDRRPYKARIFSDPIIY